MVALAKIDWATWVTILLAAIGVLIAALGVLFTIASVVLGALAIFGFRDLKATVIEQAAAAAKEAANKAFADVIAGYPSSDQMKEWMFARFTQQLAPQDAAPKDETAAQANAPAATPDTGQLANIYPEEIGLPTSDVPPEHDEDAPHEK